MKVFHLASVYIKQALAKKRQWILFIYGFFLHNRVLTCTCVWHGNLLTKLFLEMLKPILETCLYLMQQHLRSPKHGIYDGKYTVNDFFYTICNIMQFLITKFPFRYFFPSTSHFFLKCHISLV